MQQCGRQPDNRLAWLEFCKRFDDHIWLVLYRESRTKKIFKTTLAGKQILSDLVQDVYLKLLAKDCRALKDFKGAHEHSIFTYLAVIAKNVINNYLVKMNAQKRPKINGSINDISPQSQTPKEYESPQPHTDHAISYNELLNEIDSLLDDILKGKDRERNKLIFHLFFYEGFSADEISTMPPINLSSKRISNLVSETKKRLCIRLMEKQQQLPGKPGTMLFNFVLTNG
ncbi:sigma-70 family RNA polymerase sigma factor [candidate division KSB1 bacterium]|nr:sigma-70 family RNA polymerase sigma factor [candidate division KSB1 bacterium]